MCTPIRRGRRIELLQPATPDLENTLLYAGDGVRITRWWCRVPFEERTEEHVRDCHSVIFVRSGSYLLEGPRGRGVVDATCAALYNPGEGFTGAHPNGCGDDGWGVLLDAELVRPLLRRHRPELGEAAEPMFPSPVGPVGAAARLRHRLLLAAVERGDDGLAIEEATQALLDALADCLFDPRRRAVAGDPEDADPRPYVERAALYLASSFRGPVRLADVARASYTSTFHLCRLFKARTGDTLHRYLQRLRLHAALDALAAPGADVWQVARDVGFVSHSHFTATFRRAFGCTPTEARRLVSGARRGALRARLGAVAPADLLAGAQRARPS